MKGKTVAYLRFWQRSLGRSNQSDSTLGASVITISGPDGYVYDPDGIKVKK
ncbi:MAG: hypothetical protein R2738_08685 [Bacteroides graminisolvens]